MSELTINGLVEMAYGTAKANGWHDRQGETLDADHAAAQLASLARIITAVAQVAEAIRKPAELDTGEAARKLRHEVEQLCRNDIRGEADSYLDYPMDEVGKFVDGSKTQVQSWLVLMVTELAEAMEAVEKGDKANFAEELAADVPIRIGDAIGAINDTPGHFLGPIDMPAEIEAKNERNRARGYRHQNDTGKPKLA